MFFMAQKSQDGFLGAAQVGRETPRARFCWNACLRQRLCEGQNIKTGSPALLIILAQVSMLL
ncbi:MAG: hypothetical protein KJZ57_07975, partial [Anaerolineales bacterium]|nr:hypothetical protein [Anaerolineales bacterium]